MADRISSSPEIERAILHALMDDPANWRGLLPAFGEGLALGIDHFTSRGSSAYVASGRRKLFILLGRARQSIRPAPVDPVLLAFQLREDGDEDTAAELAECTRVPYSVPALRTYLTTLEMLRQRRAHRAETKAAREQVKDEMRNT